MTSINNEILFFNIFPLPFKFFICKNLIFSLFIENIKNQYLLKALKKDFILIFDSGKELIR